MWYESNHTEIFTLHGKTALFLCCSAFHLDNFSSEGMQGKDFQSFMYVVCVFKPLSYEFLDFEINCNISQDVWHATLFGSRPLTGKTFEKGGTYWTETAIFLFKKGTVLPPLQELGKGQQQLYAENTFACSKLVCVCILLWWKYRQQLSFCSAVKRHSECLSIYIWNINFLWRSLITHSHVLSIMTCNCCHLTRKTKCGRKMRRNCPIFSSLTHVDTPSSCYFWHTNCWARNVAGKKEIEDIIIFCGHFLSSAAPETKIQVV